MENYNCRTKFPNDCDDMSNDRICLSPRSSVTLSDNVPRKDYPWNCPLKFLNFKEVHKLEKIGSKNVSKHVKISNETYFFMI